MKTSSFNYLPSASGPPALVPKGKLTIKKTMPEIPDRKTLLVILSECLTVQAAKI